MDRRKQVVLIVVASLGYFVDIYDLILFNFVKGPSLAAIGVSAADIKEQEIILFNWQMAGMLIGGILWGILGDKKGRLKVLFGSILMYSLANILNAHVQNLSQYALIRFVAGLGLAGELGAGITLVSEMMHRTKRGIGTMIIVTFGALGAVFGYLVADKTDWKVSYYVGGLMGLALLLLRVGTMESKMFTGVKNDERVSRGEFLYLFKDMERFRRFLYCIGVGLPVWYVVGVLISLSESYFKKYMGFSADLKVGEATLFCYIGLSAGDLISGLLSQLMKSRRVVIFIYLVLCMLLTVIYAFAGPGMGRIGFNALCLALGAATGYWALFVMVAAEQFGTNLRATVTTSVPNFVRGSVIPITLAFKTIAGDGKYTLWATLATGAVIFVIALYSTARLKESFDKDLNYTE